MGYRSDVAYSIRFTPNKGDEPSDVGRGAFLIFLEQVMNDEDCQLCFIEERDLDYPKEGLFIDKEKCTINFFSSSVKWYEDYPDVKCHEALIQTARDWLAEENPNAEHLGYAFARIGEDIEDNTEDIGGNADYDWISISRQMNCDWL